MKSRKSLLFTSPDCLSSLLASCLSSSLIKPPQLLTSGLITISIIPNCSGRKRKSRHVLKASAGPFSYQKFIHFAFDETKRRTLLVPSPLQLKERAEKLENWRMKEKRQGEKKKVKHELLHRQSSIWIDGQELEKKIMEVMVDGTQL